MQLITPGENSLFTLSSSHFRIQNSAASSTSNKITQLRAPSSNCPVQTYPCLDIIPHMFPPVPYPITCVQKVIQLLHLFKRSRTTTFYSQSENFSHQLITNHLCLLFTSQPCTNPISHKAISPLPCSPAPTHRPHQKSRQSHRPSSSSHPPHPLSSPSYRSHHLHPLVPPKIPIRH